MSEKIYAWMLNLYPAHFRQEYEAAAMQLFGDRFRAERGFSRRLRFWLDMIADLALSVPREHSRQTALHRAAAAAVTMDHGEVLSGAEVYSTARLVFLFVAMALMVATFIAFAYFHPPSFIRLIPFLCFSSWFFGPKVVLIYENGIKLPRRYFRWEQIERCNWDGDVLTITGLGQDLSGRPVEGGSVRIWFGSPCFRRPLINLPSQWERIVAQKMAGRPAPEPSTTTLVQPAETKAAESPK